MLFSNNKHNNISESSISESSKIGTISQLIVNNDVHRENFDYLLKKVNTMLIAKQYKTAIKIIKNKEEEFGDEIEKFYILFDIKMKCYFKILSKKINSVKSKKKNKNNNSQSIKEKINSIEKIFNKVKSIFSIQNQTISQQLKFCYTDARFHIKEIIIQNYSELLFYEATFRKNFNQTQDSIALLSIANNILKSIIDNCKDPNTLLIHQKILLLMSVIYIEDKSYVNCIDNNKICLKICLKEMFLRHSVKNKEVVYTDKGIAKIIVNIVICFYQIGICAENIDDEVQAVEAYKQAKWFSITFANFFPLKIIKFIAGTCTFCIEKHEKGVISSKIKKKEKIKKILENFENEKNLEKTQKLSKISAGIPYVDKFVSLKKYLDSMHDRNRLDRNEAVTINSLSLSNSQNKYKENGLMNSVMVYNDLLSERYQNFINSVDDLSVNNMKRDTRIQLEHYNLKLLTKKEIKQILFEESKKRMNSDSRSKVKKKEKVPKLKIKNKFTFCQNFIKKRNFLEQMSNKELKFQKSLLKLKNYDNTLNLKVLPSDRDFDKKKIENEAEILYMRLKDKIEEEIKLKNKQYEPQKRNEEIEKLLRLKEKYKNGLIVSLNSSQIEKIKEIDREANELKKEINHKNLSTTTDNINSSSINTLQYQNINSKGEVDIEVLNKHNHDILSFLLKEINTYEEKEKYFLNIKK